jgi:hypothetical protein
LIGVAGVFLEYTSEGERLYEEFRFYKFTLIGDEKTMFLPISEVEAILRVSGIAD